ncbi:dTDP-4-dehydrorhamnose 3,5-epimerase family protein [Mesorhizobium sp. M0684]|uniref:dTDP-4-dehydrorhamnose 3,5-epimerase family protein n=1 Tax=Mesorhizobium sp. M0684 TaxID=2956986 RepID=UPI003339B8CE
MQNCAEKVSDAKGYFVQLSTARGGFSDTGLECVLSRTKSFFAATGVLRRLHCQLPPRVQETLFRVVRGEVFDVAADILATRENG